MKKLAIVGTPCQIETIRKMQVLNIVPSDMIIFTIGLFIGVIIALKYLLWEMENLPGVSSGKSYTFLAVSGDKGKWQIWLGWIVSIAIFILAWFVAGANGVLAWFIISGLLMGLICQRSRFCIVKAFRDPFMTGEADGSIGVMAGLLVTLVGFTAIKYFLMFYTVALFLTIILILIRIQGSFKIKIKEK